MHNKDGDDPQEDDELHLHPHSHSKGDRNYQFLVSIGHAPLSLTRSQIRELITRALKERLGVTMDIRVSRYNTPAAVRRGKEMQHAAEELIQNTFSVHEARLSILELHSPKASNDPDDSQCSSSSSSSSTNAMPTKGSKTSE